MKLKMNGNNKRTIIQNMRSLQYYPFEQLNPTILGMMNKVIVDDSVSIRRKAQLSLKLFECFLQISNKNNQIVELSNLKCFIKPFIGFLWSVSAISISSTARYVLTQRFLAIVNGVKIADFSQFYIDKMRYHSASHECHDDVHDCIKAFAILPLVEERVYYWQGWWSYNKTDMPWFIPLIDIYNCYGRTFTDRLFFQLDTAYVKRRRSITPGVSDFCRWLPTSNYTLEQFAQPHAIDELFQKFLIHFMEMGYNNGEGSSVKQLIKRWRTFITFVENNLLGSVFAEPIGQLIVPAPAPIKGGERRVKTTISGIEVKEKLLTDVPLNLTDKQAIELLFQHIQSDFDHIITTATQMTKALWRNYLRRKTLAPIGKVKPVKGTVSMSEQERQWIIHINNPNWLANASATFEADYFSKDSNGAPLVTSSYSVSVREAAYKLGLPKAYSLIPYMVLLVSEHPNIVASFLTDFELYDKHGKQTGFVELDKVWVLDGRKRRSGPANAQQVIVLTENSKAWIEQIIAITDCVRQYFKTRGNDSWRYLFLTCGKGFRPERMGSQYAQAKRRFSQGSFYHKLCTPSVGMSTEHANKLSQRFDLGSLRASAGVLIFLKTRSAKTMAKALGHKEYSPKTLSHYLPEPVFDFFQSRWIRIFQQGIIIEAMKDSPQLLDATAFGSMDEFHEFMKNHALKKIPLHLEDPYHDFKKPASNMAIDEIVFNINTTVLTLLLSLQQAVTGATQPVSGKAVYWSEVTAHLVSHIEHGSDHGTGEEFKDYLKIARKQANAHQMGAIVYA
jgi:hypothetical protein